MAEKILLDAHDVRILRVLQRDTSLAIADIAKEAGMSQTPCWRRIKRMRSEGTRLNSSHRYISRMPSSA
jgi:Lrp/AsnC family transcriptional regulator